MLMLDEGIPPRPSTPPRATSACRWAHRARRHGRPRHRGRRGRELAKPGTPIPKKLMENIEAKNFGMKTGKGFYTWVKGKAQKGPRPRARTSSRSPTAWCCRR
jgi:hypothetical protein